jgi:hypothetical protein
MHITLRAEDRIQALKQFDRDVFPVVKVMKYAIAAAAFRINLLYQNDFFPSCELCEMF